MKIKNSIKILLLGEILGFIIVFLLLIFKGMGADGEGGYLYTALFWVANDMVQLAKKLRPFNKLLVMFVVSICILSISLSQKIKDSSSTNKIYYSFSILNGIFINISIIYFLLNYAYFIGALMTVPFLLGGLILFSSMSMSVFDNNKNEFFIIKRFKNMIYVLIILLLILPNFSAMGGFLPKPENNDFNPDINYDKYDINEIIIDSEIPEFIVENMTEVSKDFDWNVHLYIPDPIPNKMPVAIYLHGYEGEEEWVYIDSFESMTSNGVAVIFPQYASNYDVSKYDENMLKYFEGGSNHPQHEWRYSMAWNGIIEGYTYLKNNYDQTDVSNLWVGGHSMGSGTSMYVASEASKLGWGNNSFIINLEAPWIYSNYQPYKGNMSLLPEHTIVNVVEYEDDVVVEKCIGVWTFERLRNKDGYGQLKDENVFYLKVFSDRRGFPKLISSHYVQATPIRDHLADFAYYKRITAQSAYLSGIANNDAKLIENSSKFFKINSEEMKNMGYWSNGEEINKIVIKQDPLNDDSYNCI